MTLTIINGALALLCVSSAVYVAVQYWGLNAAVSSHESQLQSVRNKLNYDESKIRSMVRDEFETVTPERDTSKDDDGMGGMMRQMMQMQMMKQMGEMMPQQPAPEPADVDNVEPRSDGGAGTPLLSDWMDELEE